MIFFAVAYVQLPASSRIHYKYIVDRNWQYDPSDTWEHDGYGNINNVLITPGPDGSYPPEHALPPVPSKGESAQTTQRLPEGERGAPHATRQVSSEAASAMHEANAFSMALAHPDGYMDGDGAPALVRAGSAQQQAGAAIRRPASLAAAMALEPGSPDPAIGSGAAQRGARGRILVESALLDGGPVEVPEIARPFMQWATPAEVVAAVRSMRTTPPIPQAEEAGAGAEEGDGDSNGDEDEDKSSHPPARLVQKSASSAGAVAADGAGNPSDDDDDDDSGNHPPDSPMGENMPRSPAAVDRSLTGRGAPSRSSSTGSLSGASALHDGAEGGPVARSEEGTESELGLRVAAGLDQIIGGGRVTSAGEMRNIRADQARSNDLHVHMKEYGLQPVVAPAPADVAVETGVGGGAGGEGGRASGVARQAAGGGAGAAPREGDAEALQRLRQTFVQESDSMAEAYKKSAWHSGAGAGAATGSKGAGIGTGTGTGTGTGIRASDSAGGRAALLSHVAATVRKEGKLVIAVVGLPARGKTYIARKLKRHLTWMGLKTEIFNVGNYRRKHLGAAQPHGFFDPSNAEGVKLRRQMATAAMDEMVEALRADVDIAVFDATNSSRDRRAWLRSALDAAFGDSVRLMFLESICTDEHTIRSNVRETKLKSPDYQHMTEQEAVADFLQRIAHYVKVYQPVEESEDVSYIKLVDVGRQIIANRVQGYLNSRIMFFLSSLHITPRPIWITRHGESQYNVQGRIGGDSGLSARGQDYGGKLAQFMRMHYPEAEGLTVWTSTLKRTNQTGQHLAQEIVQWKQLDEIDAGICDGMTYEAIAATMPEEYSARARDKYNYRYPRGESYRDLTHRLEPVIMELMRQKGPVLIISH